MKRNLIIGVLLIILGAVALFHDRITYKEREKIVDLGPIKASVEHEKAVPLPMIFGIVVILIGGVLIFTGRKGK